MSKFNIKKELCPTRCEICHQNDKLDNSGVCCRCTNVGFIDQPLDYNTNAKAKRFGTIFFNLRNMEKMLTVINEQEKQLGTQSATLIFILSTLLASFYMLEIIKNTSFLYLLATISLFLLIDAIQRNSKTDICKSLISLLIPILLLLFYYYTHIPRL